MNEVPWAAVVTGVSTLTGTLGAVLLTMWLTGRRSRQERLWDLKRVAYSELLMSLREAELAASEAAAMLDDPDRNQAALKELYSIFQDHQRKLRQRMAADTIILPPAVCAHYERSFEHGVVSSDSESSKAVHARAVAAHLKQVRSDIIAMARLDLDQID